MEAHQVVLTIAPAAWCDQAAAMLAGSIRGAPCYTIEDMRAEIALGGAKLYSVTSDSGELVGFAVLRVEHYQGGAEGVIVAGAGKIAGGNLYSHIVPALERLFTGVKTIRVESCRRAATEVLLELGYLPTHAIFRKAAPLELRGDDALEALAGCMADTRGGPDIRGRPGKLHGGGGGKSSSSSTQETNNIDRRIVADGGSIGISSDSSSVTINALDGGAINAALDFAKASDQETGRTLNQVLGIAANVFDKAGRNVDSSAALVARAYDDAKGAGAEKTILIGAALATVAIVALKVLK